ncbi:MAG: peptidoglycan editing factor PgeF [Desulfuromonas thiophila]|nr:peptidoglycan editing factor PgeF [Desulfuromonas thiophila]
MELVRQGKISYLQAAWAKPPQLFAGVTIRNGGVSRPPYNSLNLGSNTDDAPYNVEGNRSTLAHSFDIALHELLLVKQVHGNDILLVDDDNHDVSHFQSVEADAIITARPGLMIGVTVADCYPLLLADPRRRVAAVAHLGWRGMAAGLIGKTVAAMVEEFGCQRSQLLAALGPGISARHYRVGKEVRDAFRANPLAGDWSALATEVALGQWQLDLQKSALLQLAAAGIDGPRCDASDLCSYRNKDMLFSYRRDQGQTGRQMGFVLLR